MYMDATKAYQAFTVLLLIITVALPILRFLALRRAAPILATPSVVAARIIFHLIWLLAFINCVLELVVLTATNILPYFQYITAENILYLISLYFIKTLLLLQLQPHFTERRWLITLATIFFPISFLISLTTMVTSTAGPALVFTFDLLTFALLFLLLFSIPSLPSHIYSYLYLGILSVLILAASIGRFTTIATLDIYAACFLSSLEVTAGIAIAIGPEIWGWYIRRNHPKTKNIDIDIEDGNGANPRRESEDNSAGRLRGVYEGRLERPQSTGAKSDITDATEATEATVRSVWEADEPEGPQNRTAILKSRIGELHERAVDDSRRVWEYVVTVVTNIKINRHSEDVNIDEDPNRPLTRVEKVFATFSSLLSKIRAQLGTLRTNTNIYTTILRRRLQPVADSQAMAFATAAAHALAHRTKGGIERAKYKARAASDGVRDRAGWAWDRVVGERGRGRERMERERNSLNAIMMMVITSPVG